MNELTPLPTATMVERIMFYVETDQHDKAEALAKLGDHLEACASWELTFDTEGLTDVN